MPLYKVTGYTLNDYSSFSPAEKIDYTILVEFGSSQDHDTLLEHYIRYHLRIDQKQEENGYLEEIRNDANCARALVRSYFQKQMESFKDDLSHPVRPGHENEPSFRGDNYKLWITETNRSSKNTEKNVAGELYRECAYSKISVQDAKRLIADRFPNEYFNWKKVLLEFGKLNGKYTKLYLRRD